MRRWTVAAVTLAFGMGTISPAAANPPASVAGVGGTGVPPRISAPANTGGGDNGGPGSPPSYSPGLIVKYAPNVVLPQSEGNAVPGEVAAELELTAGAPVGLGWFEADLPEAVTIATAQDYAERLMTDPVIEYAEPQLWMRTAQAAPAPNDPLWNQQWGFSSYGDDTFVLPPENTPLGAQVVGTNLLEGLGAPRGDTPVVAVIDTGITNHPDLGGRLVPGYNFISNPAIAGNASGRGPDGSDPGDWISDEMSSSLPFSLFGCLGPRPSSWHGTHVAGTISAVTDNNLGIAGTVPTRIQSLRVLGHCGGASGDIAAAMLWAAGGDVPGVPANPTPARVVNLSVGGVGQCPQHYQEVINYGRAQGTVYVVAAGNEGSDAATITPASCDGVITVAATDELGGRAWFSNFGDKVEIAAPGVPITSTLNAGLTTPGTPGYATYGGTSMAAPHVAGAVALLLAAEPELTVDDVSKRLTDTATPFKRASASGNPALDCVGDDQCGAGYLNTAALVGQPTKPGPVSTARFQVRPVATPATEVAPANEQVEVSVAFNPAPGEIDDYRVVLLRDEVPVGETISEDLQTAFVVEGSTADAYQVLVTARRSGEGGVITQAMRVPSLSPSAPAAPQIAGVSANDTSARIYVSGTYSNPEPTATLVTAQPGNHTCEVTDLPTRGGCTIDGLTTGVGYTFTAVSRNDNGDSTPSDPTTATPVEGAPPTSPGVPSVTMQGTTATLTWTPSIPSQGRYIDSYVVFTDPADADLQQCVILPNEATPPSYTCQLANLLVGHSYSFRVSATDDLGNTATSELSAPVTVGGVAVPPAAPDIPPVVEPGDGQVTVSIDNEDYPIFNGGSPILAVRVVASPGGASCDIPYSAGVYPRQLSCVISGLTNGQPYTFTTYGVNAMGVSGPSNQSMPFTPEAQPAKGAEYVSLATPIRVFDSRTSGGPIASGVPRIVDVLAPEDAVAVAYNLTVTSPTTAGHAVVGPAGVALPSTSTINWFAPGQTFANGYVSEVGTNGDIQLTVRGGTAQLIVDVLGYYVSAGPSPSHDPSPGPDVLLGAAADDPPNGDQVRSVFTPLAPSQRVYDSRTGDGRLGGGQSRTVELGDVAPVGATAVAYTITEFDTAGTGHLAIGLPGTPKPPTSVLNWSTSGQRVANSTVANLDGQRALEVFAGGGFTGFTIDVLGYFSSVDISPEGLRFTPITPARAYDSREADAGGALAGGQRRATPASPPGQIPPPGTQAMAFNLTEVDTVGTGHLRVTGGDTGTPPNTSAINWYQSGMRLANGSITDIADGRITTFAWGGSSQYLIDVAGYYH